MIEEDILIVDDLDDEVKPLLTQLLSRKTWTARMNDLKNELTNLLRKKKYISFSGDPKYYKASIIGQSYLIDVPQNQRGHLAPFRGVRVRVICVGSGRYKRQYMAGIVAS